MPNPLDSLRAAHAAGYVHGLIIGGIMFSAISIVLTAVALSWFVLRHRRPDPDYIADPSRHHRIEGGR